MISKNKSRIWNNRLTQQWVNALFSIDDIEILKDFIRDVMTEKEIIEISSRLEAARMLQEGFTYINITKKTKLSSRTISRISDWTKNGCNGYKIVLTQINNNPHIKPVCAE